MHKYTIPSLAAYHKRKIFHSNERNQFEANDEWYRRISESLYGCEYGEFADFMIIDKLISGLDYETFRKYAERTSLTIDDIASKLDNSQNDVNGMLVDVEIKLEVSRSHL